MERSFKEEVGKLRLGDGEVFHGEGILAVTKALLQSGVSYVGGYQGAPVSHMMDVLNDARDIINELGVHIETNASEAGAAAMLGASINYPLRGAVTFKSTVGTNVASDALSNLASAGVKGGALIVLGEDYGEGASIIQERSHAFAMKSQIWLLDPRPNLPKIVEMVEHGFALSEASSSPVMLELRIRACHVQGSFATKNNRAARFSTRNFLENPDFDFGRISLPPSTYAQEKHKIEVRWPAAVKFIREHKLNETFAGSLDDVGIILQGGMYNTVIRALQQLGLADAFGASQLPLYVMNVTYPMIPDEVSAFCAGKRAVLVVEEGQPNYIEEAIHAVLRKADLNTTIVGKDVLPMAGEYTGDVLVQGVREFLRRHAPQLCGDAAAPVGSHPAVQALSGVVPQRPAGFCTGCPERPIFTAMKMVEKEVGPMHVSADIGCHLFSILPPFNIGNTTMGYGLGGAAASAFNVPAGKKAVAIMGDGGFWHNGLTSGIGNSVFNRSDGVTLVVDNGYSAATGGQDLLSSRADNRSRNTNHPIEQAVRGVGVKSVTTITRTYDLEQMRKALKDAVSGKDKGHKVIVAQSECMLNKQRRVKPLVTKAIQAGERVVRERFVVDADTCTGDHACIRMSGCPSLTIKPNPDPLRVDPVTHIEDSCVGCGLCGEAAHAAALCPSFMRADIVYNPSGWERFWQKVRGKVIGALQARTARRLNRFAF